MSKFTSGILIFFGLYFAYTAHTIYSLFFPPKCLGGERNCIGPAFTGKSLENLKLTIFTGTSRKAQQKDLKMLWDSGQKSILEYQESSLNISLSLKTRRNGTLFAYVFVHPREQTPFHRIDEQSTYQIFPLTKFIVPKGKVFNLIDGFKGNITETPITHMYPKLVIYTSTQNVQFERQAIPQDVYRILRFTGDGKYLPLLYVDSLSAMDKYLVPVEKNSSELPIIIYHTPVSIGRLRIWSSVEQTIVLMKNLGFTDKDMDELKGLFTDTNLYFLGLTFAVSLFHMLFDVLAFKNDISFWKDKKSMEGMSIRAVIWRCVSSTIIFFYLMDESTSLLVLIPSGIGVLIEMWKVRKALKVGISWSGWLPSLQFGERSKSEQETEEYDVQAMRYLSYPLYPLLIAASIYSLVYYPHKSWYSWIVRSLANGVYVFGFLFMLPQLFVNYKLKSVAHLPWRAFMYKAFNTFIDDVFAFIITMPTVHRVACFRDDVIFVIYLYQRWLYPVDKTRANEYGMVFEEKTDDATEDTKTTETKKDQ